MGCPQQVLAAQIARGKRAKKDGGQAAIVEPARRTRKTARRVPLALGIGQARLAGVREVVDGPACYSRRNRLAKEG